MWNADSVLAWGLDNSQVTSFFQRKVSEKKQLLHISAFATLNAFDMEQAHLQKNNILHPHIKEFSIIVLSIWLKKQKQTNKNSQKTMAHLYVITPTKFQVRFVLDNCCWFGGWYE